MLSHFSHLVLGVLALSSQMESVRAADLRTEAIEHYLSRLIPIEQEIFGYLEEEWQTAVNLDEWKRAERFRTAMLGYLAGGLEDRRVHPLIPRDLKSIYETRLSLATRDLQNADSKLRQHAEEIGATEHLRRFNLERAALDSMTPPFGLSDAQPDRFRIRRISAESDGPREDLHRDSEPLSYARSLSRLSLAGELRIGRPRTGQIFLLSGDLQHGYLAVEFSTGHDPRKYFFGVYEDDRQVAALSLPLEVGKLYRWRFEIETSERTGVFELFDEQARQQRLCLPWRKNYELGFGIRVESVKSPARMMLMLLAPSLR